MLSWDVVQLLGSQYPEVITDEAPSLFWIDDVVDKTPLSTDHRVSKPRCVFFGMLFQVL